MASRIEYSWLIADDETDLCDWSEMKYATEQQAFESLVAELERRGIA
jgi:hypothetical protein